MHINGWHVHDFGILRDHRLAELSPRLNVFLGPNEAGKSTLLAFIQRMLFGFEPSPASAKRFESVAGGRPGGVLHLTGDNDAGMFRLERFADRHGGAAVVTLQDGSLRDEAWLSAELAGVDRALFESLFAFSLTELQDFSSLDRERIRERLFTVGLVGSGSDALATAGKFRRRAADYSNPQSAEGRAFAKVLSEIGAAQARLDQAIESAAGYPGLLRSRDALQEALQSGREELEEIGLRSDRVRNLLEAHPTWMQIQSLREAIAGLPEGPTYPPDGLQSLARLDQEEERLDQALSAIQGRIGEGSAQVSGACAGLNEAFVPLAGEIERFEQSAILQESRIKRVGVLRARSEQAVVERNARFVQLPGEWDFESVQGFSWGVEEQRRLGEWRVALGESDRSLAGAVRAEAEAKEASRRLHDSLADLRERLGTGEESTGRRDVAGDRARIRALREELRHRGVLEAELRACEDAIGLVDSTSEEAAEALQKAETNERLALILTLMWPLLLGCAGVWSLMIGGGVGGGILLLLAVVALVLGWKVCRVFRAARAGAQAHTEANAQRLDRLRSDRAACLEALGRCRSGLEGSAFGLGFEAEPDEAALDALERELLDCEHATMWRGVLESRLVELAAEVERADTLKADTAARRAELERERKELDAEWSEWKSRAGLTQIQTPAEVADFLATIRVAKEKLESVQDIHRELDELQREVTDWNAEAAGYLKRAGWEPPKEKGMEAFLAPIRALAREVRADVQLRAELAVQATEVSGWEQEAEVLRGRLEDLRSARSAFLAKVEVETSAEYQAGFERHRQRNELRVRLEALEAGLTRGRSDTEAIWDELSNGDPAGWQRELGGLAQRQERLQRERDEALQELARLEDRIGALTDTADAADSALALEVGRARLALMQEQWCVDRAAEALILESLHRFVQERQPKVLEMASRYYERVTGGRYHKVVQKVGTDGLLLITSEGTLQDPRVLSRGALEQLYLCLRLGLIVEYGENGCRLPLVMDDVLVNFDPERARATAELLVEFSATNQVFLFTCHPSTAGMINEMGEDVAFWSLGGEG